MKAMKKVFAMLLAVVMVLGLSVTAFAAEITVNGVAGQTYTAYKIFDVTKSTEPTSYEKDTAGTYYHNTTNNTYETQKDDTSEYETDNGTDVMYSPVYSYSYSIKPNSEWLSVIASESDGVYTSTVTGLTLTLSGDGSQYDVTVDDTFVPADFAETLIGEISGKTPATAAVTADTDGTAKITGLDAGYYLVDSSLGALCILNTASDTVTVNEKNAQPTLAKTVEEDSDSSWGASATADMNQIVNFKLTVNVGSEKITDLGTGNDKDFVITDTLPNGMTYQEDAAIEGWTKDTDYSVTYTPGTETAQATVVITLKTSKLTTLAQNSDIVITYSAKVDQDDAVVGGDGNVNTAKLVYGTYNTTEVSTTVYTYQIGGEDADGKQIFEKIDGTTKEALANVEFVLSKTVDGTPYYAVLTEVKDGDTVTGYKLSEWTTTETSATAIKTNAEGGILVQGLDADTYTLTETKTLEGYNKLTYTITVVIDANGNVTYQKNDGTNTTASTTIQIENNAGTELPSTGGIGTTIFYVVGSILVIGAAVLLITKKRMNGTAE